MESIEPTSKKDHSNQNKSDKENDLTEDEFQQVVDVFRTLIKWDQELKKRLDK